MIHDILTAASGCALYDNEHDAVIEFSGKAIEKMEEFFAEGDSVNFTMLGTSLLFNDKRVTDKGITVLNFVKRLRRKGVEKIIFRKGIAPEELIAFVSDLTSYREVPTSSKHIAIGIVEVKLKGGGLDISSVVDENVEKVKGVHVEVDKTKKLDMVMLEEIAMSLISALRSESDLLKVLSPVKSYSEYTFVHTTNVSILALYLAESLGLEGEMLHEVGLAGLLHDIGKIFIPKEILHKAGKLEYDEFEAMKNHSLLGAMYLSELQDASKLGIIAAFEHHMRYDGKGYPVPKRRGHNQHAVSQIIAVADFFDALRSDRPYRKGLDIPVIVGLLKESAGTQFNPVIVDHFLNTLHDRHTV
jgi:putative nucleotidyltransferase with HDIG domain